MRRVSVRVRGVFLGVGCWGEEKGRTLVLRYRSEDFCLECVGTFAARGYVGVDTRGSVERCGGDVDGVGF